MKRKIPAAVILVGLIVSILGLFLMLHLTNPFESGSLGILIVFGLIYLLTLSLLLFLLRLTGMIYRLMRPTDKKPVANENLAVLANQRTNLIAAVVSLAPVFLISMNSIGQLNIVDVALIAIIEAILIFYIVRRTAK